MLAIIGGSSSVQLANLEVMRRQVVRTPYGDPSAPLAFGTIRGREMVFLARHGDGNTIPPHEINYCANIWALQSQNVTDVVSIASVGGIRSDLVPGTLAVPDQIIDYTHGRKATLFTRADRGITHVDFTHPYCDALRQRLIAAAAAAGIAITAGGTYAATQGPRLETAAEINRLERDGADMVGMTGMPEAALAREAGLCYAAIALFINDAAGRGASAREVRLADAGAISQQAMARVRLILEKLVADDGG